MATTKEKQQWIEVTDKNTADIQEIKQDVHSIKTNHLYHIEKDLVKVTKYVEKIDNRIWWVLGLLVAGLLITVVKQGLGI